MFVPQSWALLLWDFAVLFNIEFVLFSTNDKESSAVAKRREQEDESEISHVS